MLCVSKKTLCNHQLCVMIMLNLKTQDLHFCPFPADPFEKCICMEGRDVFGRRRIPLTNQELQCVIPQMHVGR